MLPSGFCGKVGALDELAAREKREETSIKETHSLLAVQPQRSSHRLTLPSERAEYEKAADGEVTAQRDRARTSTDLVTSAQVIGGSQHVVLGVESRDRPARRSHATDRSSGQNHT